MANIVANYLYIRDGAPDEVEDSRITTIASIQYDKGQEAQDREQLAHEAQPQK